MQHWNSTDIKQFEIYPSKLSSWSIAKPIEHTQFYFCKYCDCDFHNLHSGVDKENAIKLEIDETNSTCFGGIVCNSHDFDIISIYHARWKSSSKTHGEYW